MNPMSIDITDTDLVETLKRYERIPWGGLKLILRTVIGAAASVLVALKGVNPQEPWWMLTVMAISFGFYAVMLLRAPLKEWWRCNGCGYSLVIDEEVPGSGYCRFLIVKAAFFSSPLLYTRNNQDPTLILALGGWRNRHRISMRDTTGLDWRILSMNPSLGCVRMRDKKNDVLTFRFHRALLALRRWEANECANFEDLPFPDKISLTSFHQPDPQSTLYC